VLDPHVLSRPGTVLLDTARTDSVNRVCWCFTAPQEVLTADTPAAVPDLVESLQEATQSGAHVAGYLSHEAGYPFVDLDAPSSAKSPVGWFGIYDRPYRLAPSEVQAGLETLEYSPSIEDAALSVSRDTYIEAIRRIRQHIGAGDVYQINYTAPVRFRAPGDPRALYRRLRRRQRVPYGAYLNVGGRQILCCSPELFFRRDGDRVRTRPMKGTIRRGRTLEEDQSLRERLAADPKNRAENLMIVDLLRNDLSMCCRPGSVQVPELYTTEEYESVTQMTSTVEGKLRPDQGLADLMKALFPCGSISGAPKRRAMRVIRDLEREPRGIYCGTIGAAGPGHACFNVAIRTAVIEGKESRMGVGSGIVWDSDPQAEYDECKLKTKFLTASSTSEQSDSDAELPCLIETMRFDGVQIPMLDQHVSRLARSASYFNYPFDEARFRRRVHRAVAGGDGQTVAKVRATLDPRGCLEVEMSPIQEGTGDPWRLTVADERVDREDPLFYHKTTHRRVYERALQAAQRAGFDEAILLNQEGEVTEGTYTNIFVEIGGELLTPPVDCGLLAGVYRSYVLEKEERARAEVLTLNDLHAANGIYCCNAVRGWCEAIGPSVPSSSVSSKS